MNCTAVVTIGAKEEMPGSDGGVKIFNSLIAYTEEYRRR